MRAVLLVVDGTKTLVEACIEHLPLAVCRTFRAPMRAFLHAREGATAVEFGLVALPFLALAGASLEAGVTYLSQQILQEAVADAGRQIYTGKFQQANAGTSDATTLANRFRTAMCYPDGQARLTTFPCANIRVSITKATSYGSARTVQPTVTDPATGVSDWNPSFPSYTCARANDIMIVQAVIDVPVYFSLLTAASATLPNNRRVLQAATVFQVEPFDSTAACPSGS